MKARAICLIILLYCYDYDYIIYPRNQGEAEKMIYKY